MIVSWNKKASGVHRHKGDLRKVVRICDFDSNEVSVLSWF